MMDCKKCDGVGTRVIETKTGSRKIICKECHGSGKVDIIYVAVKKRVYNE